MKFSIAVVLLLASVASARHVVPENNIPYGHLRNIGIPAAERIMELEKEHNDVGPRIFHGPAARLGELPWQAGLIGHLVGGGQSYAGGSLISSNRVLTAAHNAISPTMTVTSFTIVLGSLSLISGGTRIPTSRIVLHPQYNPSIAIVNDIAMLYLASSVSTSATIAPVALPSGGELSQDFTGIAGVTSGFGMTENGFTATLRRLDVRIISNSQCVATYGSILGATHICTSSAPGSSICTGDSGGPLVIQNNNRQILVGVTSFGAGSGCGGNVPDGFTRVTSFMNFIQQNM